MPGRVDPIGLSDRCCEKGAYVEVAAKSYIASLKGTGVAVAKARGWSDAQELALGLFMAATELSYSEDPMDGDFRKPLDARIYSMTRIYMTWDCNGFTGVRAPITETGAGSEPSGTDYPFGVGSLKDPDNKMFEASRSHFTLRWRLAGKPDVIAEPIFQAISPRNSVYIWHQVTVEGFFFIEEPIINVKLEGSEFPSHRVWIRGNASKKWGKPFIEIPQKHIINLWDSAPFDATYVE